MLQDVNGTLNISSENASTIYSLSTLLMMKTKLSHSNVDVITYLTLKLIQQFLKILLVCYVTTLFLTVHLVMTKELFVTSASQTISLMAKVNVL